ncbi:MAG TPA: LysM peptidoglycan-binding domain-containing protein, partial [Candidatus Limnocylindrales bacterium]
AVVLARTGPNAGGAGVLPGQSQAAGNASVATPPIASVPEMSVVASSPSMLPPSSGLSAAPSAAASAITAPPASGQSANAAPTPTPLPLGSFVTYTVRSGDTLSGIAARYKTTVQAILDANGIKVSDYLRIGQVLRIPK